MSLLKDLGWTKITEMEQKQWVFANLAQWRNFKFWAPFPDSSLAIVDT
jgi:hypothetical protein